MKRYIYGFISGILVVFVIGLITVFLILRLGLVAVNADMPPSALESRVAKMALQASVVRHAEQQLNPVSPTEENLIAGADIYKEECARCHGQANGHISILGSSFYPPVPQLPGHPSDRSDAELFWIVKHGVRNTAMPAWGKQLSDNDIWQVVGLIKNFDSLPLSVQTELNKRE